MRWVVAQVEEQHGVPKSSLSPEAVRHAVRAAKQRIVEAAGRTGELEPELATWIPLTSLLSSSAAAAGSEPAGGTPFEGRSIRLTNAQLSQLGAGALALEDEQGRLAPPNPVALAELICAHGVRAVVLNACETHYQVTRATAAALPMISNTVKNW